MSNSQDISQKLSSLYSYIGSFIEANGYPPSIREICRDLNIKSTATANYYINKLVENNQIRKNPTKNRALELVGAPKNVSKTIPLLGRIAAGTPILAIENCEERYSIPTDFLPHGDAFMLTVSGESMIDIGIYDGDKIIVRQQNTAVNGEIVAALVDDSATVKRFYKENGHFRLHPENKSMQDIIVDDVQILGIVTGLIRTF